MSNIQNQAVVRRFLDEYAGKDSKNHGALEKELFAPGYKNYMTGQPIDLEGLRMLSLSFAKAFPDLHSTIEDMATEGDKIAVRFTVHGTHKGEFQGIPATGKHISVPALSFFKCIDGKILEDRPILDMMSMMQQLGVMPASG